MDMLELDICLLKTKGRKLDINAMLPEEHSKTLYAPCRNADATQTVTKKKIMNYYLQCKDFVLGRGRVNEISSLPME